MTINIDARHLFVGCVLVVRALAPVLPHWPQDPSYHHFADGRPLLGVANGWNVLSNLLLCAIGLVGLLALWAGRAPELEEPTRGLVAFEAMALVATAIGSMYFHYAPSNDTLLWDRLPMTLGFAGALGVAVAMRFSPQEGREALLAWLLLGVASMAIWRYTSNLMVYGVVQYGGVLALVLVVALARERAAADPFPWVYAIVAFLLVSLFDRGDAFIWKLTDRQLSGHTLKHLAAGAAGAALLWPLLRRAQPVARQAPAAAPL